jgi:hypothetical protein
MAIGGKVTFTERHPYWSLMQQPNSPSSGRAQTIAPARTGAELGALEIRRSELRRQFESNTERRSLLSAQLLESHEPVTRRNLEARIREQDARTARIDQQLSQIDDAISTSLANGVTADRSPRQAMPTMPAMPTLPGIPGMPPMLPGRSTKGAVANAMFLEGLGFVAIFAVLWLSMRRRGPASAMRLAPEETARLEQLQRNVDVIALEVERISEGQRYVTKLLSEKQPVLGAGGAPDIPARREVEPVRKRDA